jgi:hypothetical protein
MIFVFACSRPNAENNFGHPLPRRSIAKIQ